MKDCRTCKHDLDPEECRICYETHIVDKLNKERANENKERNRETFNKVMDLMSKRSGDSL